jgi:hypothetical protein
VNANGIQVGPARAGSQPECPYCREDLAELPACECSSCRVGYHLECAQELAACATVGCGGTFLATCPGCEGGMEFNPKSACEGCGRIYHPRCAAREGSCVCGRALFGERPILRARRGKSLGRRALDFFVYTYLLAVVLGVLGGEGWLMVEMMARRSAIKGQIGLTLLPLIAGGILAFFPFVFGWEAGD